MFFEYALDPALLTKWKDFRYFVEKFGWTRGRLISRYPKQWKRLVYEACSGCGDVEKSRIEERLKQIDDRLVKRPNSTKYQPNQSWMEHVVVEYDRLAFHAIIAQNNNHDHPNIPFLVGDTLDENDPLWQSPNPPVPQNAEEFSGVLKLLLISSKHIKFIDPYFKPEKPRFTRVLAQLLSRAISERRQGNDIQPELHTSIERFFKKTDLNTENRTIEDEQRIADDLIGKCQNYLPRCIPASVSLMLFIWKEKPGGEEIHNRYILTEKGGVSFGSGLDESDDDSEATDDLNRLSAEQYSIRCNQYSAESPAFELIKPCVQIIGSAKEKRDCRHG